MSATSTRLGRKKQNVIEQKHDSKPTADILRLQQNVQTIKRLHKFVDEVIEEVYADIDLTEFQRKAIIQIKADEHKKLDQVDLEHNLIDVSNYYSQYKELAIEKYRYLALLLSYDLEIENISRKGQKVKSNYEAIKESQEKVLANVIEVDIDLPYRHKFTDCGLIEDNKEELRNAINYLLSLIKFDDENLKKILDETYEQLPQNVSGYLLKHNYPQRFITDLLRAIINDRTDISVKFDKIWNNTELIDLDEFEDEPHLDLLARMILSCKKAYAS